MSAPSTLPRRVGAVALLAALAVGPAPSPAAVFEVTTLADAGPGSLRQAIMDANALAGEDAIEVAAGVTGRVELASPLPAITEGLELTGPGSRLFAVDANRLDRVLAVEVGSSETVTLRGVTLTGGLASNRRGQAVVDGGGLYFGAGQFLNLEDVRVLDNESTGRGGGLVLEGNVARLLRSTVAGNRAGGQGGGIYSATELTVEQSAIAGNRTEREGGGIAQLTDRLEIYETTITGNIADSSSVTNGGGGGIYLPLNVPVILFQVSIVGNYASNEVTGGNGVFVLGDPAFDVGNTVIAGNRAVSGDTGKAAEQCNRQLLVTDNGNLESDDSCGFTGPSDQQGVDPRLWPLAEVGGPTPSVLPRPDSPLIDTGDPFFCFTVDQRGFPRPVDGDGVGGAVCDIGATEYTPGVDGQVLFIDDFESGDTSAWSSG